MKFLHGPKELLSAAIANALDEYFLVDRSSIESQLVGDARIVLRNVALRRPQLKTLLLPHNAAGKATLGTVTGSVDRVEFRWAWASATTWVQDAELTIQGLKVNVGLEHDNEAPGAIPTTPQEDSSSSSSSTTTTTSFVNESQIQDDTTKVQVQKQGGIQAYILGQVERMIDGLTLRVIDYELVLELQDTNGSLSSMVLGGESMVFLSSGRTEKNPETGTLGLELKQDMSITGLYAMIMGGEHELSTPLMESFSYHAKVVRTGKRFGSFTKGLRVTGESDQSGLVVYAGRTQSYMFSQLSALLLTAKEDTSQAPSIAETQPNSDDSDPDASKQPSTFNMSISTMALVTDHQRFQISAVLASYVADGTVLAMEADHFTMTDVAVASSSEDESSNCRAVVKGVHVSKSPDLVVHLETIESVHIPNAFQLLQPIANLRLEFEGETLQMKLPSVELALLKDESSTTTTPATPPEKTANLQAPFPVQFALEHLSIQNGSDESSKSTISGIELYLNPTPAGTDFAFGISNFENRLTTSGGITVCGTRPPLGSNVIENLKVGAKEIHVHGGYSVKDWLQIFRPKGKEAVPASTVKLSKKGEPKDVWLLPNVYVEAIKVYITYEGAVGVKDVAFTIKQYHGKASTTGRDLVRHYTAICLTKVPGFITNADILGLSVVDVGTTTYTALFGTVSPLGTIGGLAIMTTMDSVKGAVAAGKKARHADAADKAHVGDFFRGIGYSAADAARRGAVKRGKSEGDGESLIDWAVGASGDTTSYVSENKARIGGAGGAGAGIITGTMVGGPIGGVIGGILGGVMTRKTIEHIDAEVKDRRSKASSSG